MATEQNKDAENATSSPPAVGWTGMIGERYKKIKEHAETYPYVWGSYLVVYGGFGLWFTYRFRRLMKMEDRVQGKIKRLRELVEAEEAAASSSQKPSPSSIETKSTK